MLNTRRVVLRALVATSMLLVLCLASCARNRGRGYNVVLVTLDSVRADHLGSYGYSRAATPALDALAANGVRFDQAWSHVPLTLPSHATILTGLLPHRHGVRLNGEGVLPEDAATLASTLAAAGYRTGAFVGALVLDHRFGLGRGFDTWDDEIERDPGALAAIEEERNAAAVIDRAIAWIETGDSRPFFLWAHLNDAHAPHAPPQRFATGRTAYDGEIAYADSQLARLVAALDRAGVRGRTLLVVAGDHGEALGDHGELTHGLLLHESTLRVPLIMNAPGLIDARVENAPVSLADLAPTIAGLVGVPFSPGPWGVDGRDLAKPIRTNGAIYGHTLQAESEYPAKFGWRPLASIRRAGSNIWTDARTSRGDARPDPEQRVASFRDYEQAGWEISRGEIQAALPRLERIVSEDPANPRFRLRLAIALRDAGELARALDEFRRAVAANPADAQAWYNHGVALHQAGRRMEASDAIREALKRDPRLPEAHNLLAVMYAESQQFELAIAEAETALRIDPRDPHAWNNAGNIQRALGNIDRAANCYEQAIEVAPRFPDPISGLGAIEMQRGQHASAIEHFDRALAVAPWFHQARINRGIALEMMGDRDGAAHEYLLVIEATGDNAELEPQRTAARTLLSRLGGEERR